MGGDAGNGHAYILNACDQDVTVTLNTAPGPFAIPAMAASTTDPVTPQAPGVPYALSAAAAPRVANPQPFESFAFGSGMDASANTLSWYLGQDVTDTRTVVIGLTQNELHLEQDCQIFVFYQSAVLRFAGDARFYSTKATDQHHPMEA